MKMEITYIDEVSGEEKTVDLPARWEICPRCRGEGKHVNPAVDGPGISPEEFREDPEFGEAYHRGDYDIPCEAGCDHGKVLVVEEKGLSATQRQTLRLWHRQQREVRECYRMEAAERRMGA